MLLSSPKPIHFSNENNCLQFQKPPWNFVEYTNDSFKADGGRDDKLLTVIADKLNFRYRYIDPPDRIQGSAINKNGTFPGVLGQVWQRVGIQLLYFPFSNLPDF